MEPEIVRIWLYSTGSPI